ncbi:hypothetical protein ACQ4M4_12780 [Leptolyngbya sp. AN02str]|uniref:hypothetical protein n=1 Tax=Leptolyngbya sp. AN02str TaxID=3423363 RepID=UPI003D313394
MTTTPKSRSGLWKGLGIGVLVFVGLGVIGNFLPETEPVAETAPAVEEPAVEVAEVEASSAAEPEPIAEVSNSGELQEDVETYTNLVRTVDPESTAVVSIAADPNIEGQIIIEVSQAWHYDPKQVRLQAAQALWESWAKIHNPNEPDKARIQLVDGRGNSVGGSRFLAGSLIYVDD